MDPLTQKPNSFFTPLVTNGSLNLYRPKPHIATEGSNTLVGVFIANVNTIQEQNKRQVGHRVMVEKAKAATQGTIFSQIVLSDLDDNRKLSNGLGAFMRAKLSENLITALGTKDEKKKCCINVSIISTPCFEKTESQKHNLSFQITETFVKYAKKKHWDTDSIRTKMLEAIDKTLFAIRQALGTVVGGPTDTLTQAEFDQLII